MKGSMPRWAVCLLLWGVLALTRLSAQFVSVPTSAPSAIGRGNGHMGVAFTGGGALSSFYNPANIPDGEGYQMVYSPNTSPVWFHEGKEYRHQAVQIGIPLRSIEGNLGINYFRSSLSEEILVIEELNLILKQFEVMDVFSFGLQARWPDWAVPLLLAGGGGLRFLRIDPFSLIPTETLHNTWYDVGLLAAVPWQGSISTVTFEVTPSLGYSLLNSGGGIAFPDFPTDYPPSTRSRLGYALAFSGMHVDSGLDIFSWRFSREAEALVIVSGPDPNEWHPGPILGDIDVDRNLIDGTPSERVAIHEGTDWSLLGVYYRRSGTILLAGETPEESKNPMKGYSIRIQPVWLMLERLLNVAPKLRFARYFDLQYDSATQEVPTFNETISHASFTLSLNHMGDLLDRLVWGS